MFYYTKFENVNREFRSGNSTEYFLNMKTYILLFLISFVEMSTGAVCHNQLTMRKGNKCDSLCFLVNQIKVAKGLSGKIYQEHFFNLFPNTHSELVKIYGYNPTSNNCNLYDSGMVHIIQTFFNLKYIPDSLLIERLIDLSIGASWEADAVNYVQHGMIEQMETTPELFLQKLDKRNDNEIEMFWRFYFDGPVKQYKIPAFLNKFRNTHNKQLKVIEHVLMGK